MSDEVVECEHCGERTIVIAHGFPVTSVDRDEDDGSRSFLMISRDGWLIHRCIIDDKPKDR